MVKSGSINGVPFGYIKKAVNTSIRNAKSETPGKYGSSIDCMKEGGLDITLDVIAQSPEERDSIVGAFMQEGRGEFYPGNPDTDWKYSGICGDRSSDFALTQYNPSVAYPLSFLFQTDLPFMLSRGIKGCGKQITTAGASWSTGDYLPFNTVQNWKFESWTDYTSYSTPDCWISYYQPAPADVVMHTPGAYATSLAVSADDVILYVADAGTNSVYVIDIASNLLTDTIPGLSTPKEFAIAPNGLKAYVTNNATDTVSIITLSSNQITNTINVGDGPWGIAFKHDGSKVYVANMNAHTLTPIDCSAETAGTAVSTGSNTSPCGVAVSTDDSKVYVTNYATDNVSIFNTSDLSPVTTLSVGDAPYGIVIHGTKAYVTNYNGQSISVIDTTTDTVSSTISISKHPKGCSLSPDGSKLYIACDTEKCICEVDTGNGQIIRSIDTSDEATYDVLAHSNSVYTCSYDHVFCFSPLDVQTETFQSTTVHKYGSKSLKIVNNNVLPRCGEYYIPVSLEADVEYTFGAWIYNEKYNGGEVLLELYDGSSPVSSCSGVGLTSFSLIKNTYTFNDVPTDVFINFCVNGSPDATGIFYIGAVFCIKSEDYSEDMDFTGFIRTTGNVSTVPDFQIDSPRTNEVLNPLPSDTLINETTFTKTVAQSQILDSNVQSQAFTAPQTATNNAEYTKTFTSPSTISNNSSVSHSWNQGDTSTFTFKNTTINGVTGYSIVLTDAIYHTEGNTLSDMTHYLTADGGARGNVWWHDFGDYNNWDIAIGNPDVGKNDFNFVTASGQGCTLALQMSNPTGGAATETQTSLTYNFRYLPTVTGLLKTITIAGIAGVTHVVTGYSYECHTSNSSNPLRIDVTVQSPLYNNNVETQINYNGWITSSTTYVIPSIGDRTFNFNAGAGNAITVKFYGILTNDIGGTAYIRNCNVTYETAPEEVILKTITIPAISNKTRTLTAYSFQGNTSASSNAAYYRVTVQNQDFYSGVETDIDYWNTSSTTPYTFSVNDMSITSHVTTAITIRLYGVLANGNGGTIYLRNSNAYYGTQQDYGTAVATLQVPATASSARKIIECGFTGYTTNAYNPATFMITVQNPNIGSPANTETLVDTAWTISGTPSTCELTGLDLTGDINTIIYLRLYSKLGNGGLGTLSVEDFYCTYTGGYDTPSGIPQNVKIYNTADPATKLKFCNRLPIGGSMRVNWDSTGFFKYVDDYSTNSYLTVIEASSSEVTWEQYNLTIGENGNLRYDFDVTFPVDNVPYLIFGVVSGTPQIKIAIVTGGVVGTYRSIDGNLTSATAYTVYVKDLINLSTCVLKEETSFSIKIEPKAGETCVLNYFGLYTDLITIDTERPVIYPDRNNTFALTQTSAALCMLSMAFNDRKWGI